MLAVYILSLNMVYNIDIRFSNIYKYNRIYSGEDPVFIEEDVFKTIIPLLLDKPNSPNQKYYSGVRTNTWT